MPCVFGTTPHGLQSTLRRIRINAPCGCCPGALSNLFRSRGAVTAISRPYARCYPQDAQKYFDYVLGFTDEVVILDVLRDCARHRPDGLGLSAKHHPAHLPGVSKRWKFIGQTLRKAPLNKDYSALEQPGMSVHL